MRQSLQVTADLVTFTKEILNGKLHFLCSVATSPLNLQIHVFQVIFQGNISLLGPTCY